MMWTYVLKLIVLLPLVCGLMIGSLYLWRKLETRMPGAAATRTIAVRETMMISPGVKLAVVEFEGRRLLVSVNRAGVTQSSHSPAVPGSLAVASRSRSADHESLGYRTLGQVRVPPCDATQRS